MKGREKVGILTYHRGPNYGGFLQAWHLKQAVLQLGYDAEVINYQNIGQAEAERIRFPGLSRKGWRGAVSNYLKSRPFRKPVNDLSSMPYRVDPAEVPWSDFKCVIVGSDVIWDFQNQEAGRDPSFYGAHPEQEGVPFLSYAASLGASSLEKSEVPDCIMKGLPGFRSLAVRDENTQVFVEELCGRRPEIVTDPTWLGQDPAAPRKSVLPSEYLVIYGITTHDKNASIVRQFCDRKGLHLVSAGTPCRWAHTNLRSVDPFEWTRVIADSKGVVTCTLHGSHYAIKFKKPMAFIESSASYLKARTAIDRSGRAESALAIGNTLSEEFLERTLILEPQTGGVPEEWKAGSLSWLRRSLTNL